MPSENHLSPPKLVQYSCQFVDRRTVIKKILKYIDKRGASGAPASCAVIGGVGMGKSRVLERLKWKFSPQADAVPETIYCYIPIYFNYPDDDDATLAELTQRLCISIATQTKEWLENSVIDVPDELFEILQLYEKTSAISKKSNEFQTFEKILSNIIETVDKIVLARWKFLLLLDNIRPVKQKGGVRDTLITYWREVFNEKKDNELRSHLALVVTFFDFYDQITKDDLPILNPVFLHSFREEDSKKIIKMRFAHTPDFRLKDAVVDRIIKLSGGHPFFLTDMTYDLLLDTEEGKELDLAWINNQIEDWDFKYRDKYEKLTDIASDHENKAIKSVFKLLKNGGKKSEDELKNASDQDPYQVTIALRILHCWGIVRQCSVNGRYYHELSGELFKRWFEKKPSSAVDRRKWTTSAKKGTRPKVFVSYSHEDEEEKNILLTHLGVVEKAEIIDLWIDDQIGGGDDWQPEIVAAIDQADVAILLISANFLNSDFILHTEVPKLLDRRKTGRLRIFPIIAKACVWKRHSWLADMNVRPKNGRPVWSEDGSYVNKDLAAIVDEVVDIVKSALSTRQRIWAGLKLA